MLRRPILVRFACLASVIGLFPTLLDAAPEDKKDVAPEEARQTALEADVTQGALRIVGEEGEVVECPLKHTDVKADISGFIARVKVTQTFYNPTKEKIEAVYVFPLPHESAVDDMTMVVGEKRIVGVIKRRDAARLIYEQALAAGQAAALLEQERPNIFTQSVGNIEPGQEVKIEISYVDVLNYDMGTYEFHFPMVVGPRYNPGAPIASPAPRNVEGGAEGQNDKVSPPQPDTTRVPDASKISPPVLKPGVRNGHDISLSVSLDAGVPVQDLEVANHEVEIKKDGDRKATVKIDPADSIPNKDFVLRYDVTGEKPEMAVLSHTGNYGDARRLGDGYFMLMIQPQEDERLKKSPPREIVFLVDVSGSMSGEPTAKVRGTMQEMLKLCREIDTVQVVTFASQAQQLFDKPVPVNKENIGKAIDFTRGLRGRGGTEMLKGVKMAIDQPIDKERVRIVIMLSDGYIGNEAEIIKHVGENTGDQIRFWAIGIGSSPNMFLIDGVAKQGGGMGKRLGLNDDTTALSQEVISRIQRAQLADIEIDWGELDVAETHPARIPELWAGRPVILFGRYDGGKKTAITVSGRIEGEDASWPLEVSLSDEQKTNDVLAKVWARKKIESLMQQSFYQGSPAVEEEVTALALQYRLMSQYTSFVAVDEAKADELTEPARPPRRMMVPVPLPEGTRWEGFFGEQLQGDDLVMEEAAGWQLGLQLQNRAVEKMERQVEQLAQMSTSVRRQTRRLGESNYYAADGLRADRKPFAQPGRFSGRASGFDKSGEAKQARFGYRGRHANAKPALAASAPGSGLGGGGAFGAAPLKRLRAADELRELPDSQEAGKKNFDSRRTLDFFEHSLRANVEKTSAAVQQATESADALRKDDNLSEARRKYIEASLLATAAANLNYRGWELADQAMAEADAIRGEQLEAWKKEIPSLEKKLSLVLRDRSIDEALAEVAEAAGLQITLLEGSVADAESLLLTAPARVSFLDLRGATVAQALDWILQPVRLNWTVEKDGVVAGSLRRMDGASPWVYDVSMIAIPLPEEWKDKKAGDEQAAAVREGAEQFITIVREALQLDEGEQIAWYGPGQLLVMADAKTHETAAGMFDTLARSKAKVSARVGELHKLTSARAEVRREKVAKRLDILRRLHVAAQHERFGWQLLAAAAGGELDSEALTELQIAWRQPDTKALLENAGAGVVLRSAWIVRAAAEALPEEKSLQALAGQAQQGIRTKAQSLLEQLGEKLEDADDTRGELLYAALALRSDTDFVASALPKLSATTEKVTVLPTLATALLGEPTDEVRAGLVMLIEAGVYGDDMVALTALAARRAGGEAWEAIHTNAGDLLGEQAVGGNIVVLVNRLAGKSLPLVARR